MRKLIATEVGSVPSASAEEISMLHLGWLIHACDSIDALFGPAQAERVIGGTQTVARKVAEKLGSVDPARARRCAGSNGPTRARPCIPMR